MTISVSAAIEPKPDVSCSITKDPDRLTDEVTALIEKHKHIHPPEIAKRLNVPEASLVAAAIGAGATRLIAEPSKVLAEIKEWGSVLCVFGSECGSFMPLGQIDAIDFAEDSISLSGAHLTAKIQATAITDIYLLIEQDDMHGNTRSLQFFDGAGNPVIKVYIFHKSKFKAAQNVFDTLISEDQSRVFAASTLATNTLVPNALSTENDEDVEAIANLNSKDVLASFFEDGGRFEIESITQFGRAVWEGTLKKVRMDESMLHLHEEDIRAHLRFAALSSWHYTKAGGISASNSDGRLLRLIKLK